MRPDKSILRMARFITPPVGKSFTLLATIYKGFVANGTTLVIELYETDSDLSDYDRRTV